MSATQAAASPRDGRAVRGDRFAFILHPVTVDCLARHPRYLGDAGLTTLRA